MINLTYTVIESKPADIAQMTVFALDQNIPFDADAYAEWANLNYHDIDFDDVHEIQDAQSQLGKDFWMIINHS